MTAQAGGRRHPMREDGRQALAIDASGKPRRIEIAFYRLGDDIYMSGIPGPKIRNWLANLAAQPQFTFHLQHGVVATGRNATAWCPARGGLLPGLPRR